MRCSSLISSTTVNGFSCVSADGQTWSSLVTLPFAGSLLCSAWSESLGGFSSLLFGSAGNGLTSAGRSELDNHALSPTPDHYNAMCYPPTLAIFCSPAGPGTGSQNVATSTDGANWSPTAGMPSSARWRWHLLVAGTVGHILHGRDERAVAILLDGVNWTAGTMPTGTWNTVAWSNPSLRIFLATENGTRHTRLRRTARAGVPGTPSKSERGHL